MAEIYNEFVKERKREEALAEFDRINKEVERGWRIINRLAVPASVALALGLMYVLPAATGKGSFLENLKHQYNVGIPSALGVRPRPAFDLSRIPEAERQTLEGLNPNDLETRLTREDMQLGRLRIGTPEGKEYLVMYDRGDHIVRVLPYPKK